MNALSRSLLLLPVAAAFSSLSASAASFYAQPQPSNEEQYLLELINAARANPAAEGDRLASNTDSEITRYYSHYGVNRDQLRSDFAGYAAKPPLALNAHLMDSARVHSLDQAAHGFQGHDSTDGTSFDQRITAQGYQWSALGENVFAYVENPLFGHVGLNADWGVPSLDHRANIMNYDSGFPTFKEIGISYVATSLANFGPFVMTEDFGTPAVSDASFLVGVVYNDADGSGSYDVGEGLAGVTITTDRGDYYTTSTNSGGYVLPLPSGSGTLTVTASGGSLGAPRVTTIAFGNATNVKADFTTAQAANGPVLPIVKIKASVKNLLVGGDPTLINIARSGNLNQDLVVSLALSGTAIPGVDCTALPQSILIPAGARSVDLPVQATSAQDLSAAKKIKIKLAHGTGYLVSSNAKEAKAAVKILAQ